MKTCEYISLIAMVFFFVYSISANSHDYKITDKYGRVTGYADTDDNGTTVVKDKYGRPNDIYITEDGDIEDKYGRFQGSIDD